MNFNTLSYSEDNGIGVLKFNRPKALNALNAELLKELNKFLDAKEDDRALRCLIVTGEGEKSFVAGADITELKGLSEKQGYEFALYGQETFSRLEKMPFPVIAAVNGFALGGGLELALACDFILCHEKARFGLPEVSLGIMPGFGGTQRLRSAVGLRRAREMTYTGNHYKAPAAFEMGLVNQVTAIEELMTVAMELAKAILSKAPVAVARAKQAINDGCDLDHEGSMDLEAKIFGELFTTKDAAEGVSAFIEKREAQFVGE